MASSSPEQLYRSCVQQFGCTAATAEKVAIEDYDFSVANGNCQYIYFRLKVNKEEVFYKISDCAPLVGLLQSIPLATEPGMSLIILTPMKILQRNLNRSTFVV